MTRQQQISDAAQMSDFCDNRHDFDCFAAGARWADSHPYWHKYPDEKPRTNYKTYLISITFGVNTIAKYADGKFYDLYGFEDVFDPLENQDIISAWKELPEPPKFDYVDSKR